MTTAEVGPVWMETIKCVGQVLSLGGVKSSRVLAGRKRLIIHRPEMGLCYLCLFVASSCVFS